MNNWEQTWVEKIRRVVYNDEQLIRVIHALYDEGCDDVSEREPPEREPLPLEDLD